MKRIISFITLLSLILTLSACGSKSTSSDGKNYKHDVKVTKLASKGRIPEVDVVLGDPVDGVKDYLFEKASGKTYEEFQEELKEANVQADYSAYITTQEMNGHTILSTIYDKHKEVYCMYTNGRETDEIGAIAIKGEAYGYDTATLKDFIVNTIDAEYTEITEDSELNFLPNVTDGGSGISYNFGSYTLEFYFSQYDTLSATVIYDTTIW